MDFRSVRYKKKNIYDKDIEILSDLENNELSNPDFEKTLE